MFAMKAKPNTTGGKMKPSGRSLKGPVTQETSGSFALGTGRSKGGSHRRGRRL